jgi:hypothetical protein
VTANPRPWTYRKTYIDGGTPFLTISDANRQAIAYMTLWPENVEANAKLICEAVNGEVDLSATVSGAGPDDEPRGQILR